jgi:hypothetical protein
LIAPLKYGGKETYYRRKRDLLWRQKRPELRSHGCRRYAKEHILVREHNATSYLNMQRQKRPIVGGKETYCRGKRDLKYERTQSNFLSEKCDHRCRR